MTLALTGAPLTLHAKCDMPKVFGFPIHSVYRAKTGGY